MDLIARMLCPCRWRVCTFLAFVVLLSFLFFLESGRVTQTIGSRKTYIFKETAPWTLAEQESVQENVPQEQESVIDGVPQQQESVIEDIPQRQESVVEDIHQRQESVIEDIPQQQFSVMENIPQSPVSEAEVLAVQRISYTEPPRINSVDVNVGPRYMVLAYTRSGSTFTAEVLALNENVNYMFEPLKLFEKASGFGYQEAVEAESMSRLMTKMMQCDPLITSFVAQSSFVNRTRFNMASCEQNPMLIKTIRAHGSVIRRILQLNPTLKVIHLIRDPRGILSSRGDVKLDVPAKYLCKQMTTDLNEIDDIFRSTSDDLKGLKDRYISVRYEDLADRDRSSSSVGRLYQFMDMPLDQNLLQTYYQHHYSKDSEVEVNKFKTVRGDDFDPNKWKQKMDLDKIREIETACSTVMERFNYERFEKENLSSQ